MTPAPNRNRAQEPANKRGLVEGTHNPANAAFDSFPVLGGSLQVGTVLRSGVGLYDAEVRLSSNRSLTCHQAASLSGCVAGMGATQSQLMPEGTPVLVWVPPGGHFGLILAVLPSTTIATTLEKARLTQFSAMVDPEPGTAEQTETTFNTLRKDPKALNMIPAQAGRPPDLFQGDHGISNDMGLGIWLRRIMVGVKASERAKLELFLLDELVRLVSAQYQHLSSIGEEHIYNSNGRVTMEFSGSHHQCEVQGQSEFGKPIVKNSTPNLGTYQDAAIQSTEAEDPAMLRRFQMLLGHLGGMMQFFVMQPDPAIPTGHMTDKCKDQGLLHVGMGANGDLLVSSAGDIVLQRCDKIPVPNKLKEPWDPAGDNADKLAEKKPFKYSEDTALGHTLQLRDALAWHNRMMYEPILVNNKKNWHLPEESELSTPQDQYDKISKQAEDYANNKDNRCRVVLRKDGGITLQDNKGAEISLVDGKIIITAPNGVEIRSGTNVVTTAVTDVVVKAKDSIDLTATRHDVRIKAENNLELRATGMLLESSAIQDNPVFTGKGEQVGLTGINLKAMHSRIFLWGQTVHLAGIYEVLVEAVSKTLEGVANGVIEFAASQIKAAAKDVVRLVVGTTSGLNLTEGNAALVGPSATLMGTQSTSVIENSQFWLPFRKVDAGQTEQMMIQMELDIFQTSWPSRGDEFGWLSPAYAPDARNKIVFTYRTEDQYDTDVDFKVYESLWASIARRANGMQTEWDEPIVNETTPWPGKSNYEGAGTLRRLTDESNIEDLKTGASKDFSSRVAEGKGLESATFKQYVG